jgi:uncharacterized membrane protein
MSITGRFKSYFLRGLAVLLPTIVTIWIFIWGYKFIQDNISIHINRGLGRTLWRMIEKFIMNTPFLRQVYPYIKQVTDFVFTQDKQKRMFSKVVAVEYPGKGIWSLGMVTGSGLKKVAENMEKEFLTILIPTSPTPFTGFVIMVPKEQTIELDMTIEEALRFTVSAGVITPQVGMGMESLSPGD